MQGIAQIIAVSILIEALVEYGKQLHKQPILIATVARSILMAFLFRVRVFELIGLETYQIADTILSGILISRGSNYIYDLVGKMTGNVKNNLT